MQISGKIKFIIIVIIYFSLSFSFISCKKDHEQGSTDILKNSGFQEISISFENIPINALLVDDAGNKWVGTDSGLFLYNNSTWHKYLSFYNRSVNSITAHNDEILIATSKGAYVLKIGSEKINRSDSIFGNTVGNGTALISVYGYGLFNKQWAGFPDGLAYSDGSNWKKNEQIRDNLGGVLNVRSMAFRNKDCFFGTFGNFLYHIQYSNETVDAITGASQMIGGAANPINNFNGQLTTDTIYCVFAGSDSSIWFGSTTGLTRNKDETHVSKGTFEYFLRGQRVHSVIEKSDKKIWAGTETGLYLKNDTVWINYNVSKGLPDDLINCLAEDKDLSLWIGTNKGISHFVNGGFINY